MAAAQQIKDWDPDELQRPGSLTAVAALYVRDLQVRHFAAASVSNARKRLLPAVAWLAERDVCDIAHVTRPMLARYQRHLFYYRKPSGDPLAVSTQTHYLQVLRSFFSWAVKHHHVPANPAADLEYPRPMQRLPDVLSADEVRAVFAQPDLRTPCGQRDRCILEVLYATGLRRMEICNLRIDDIDWSGGVLRVNQGKGQRDRLVPLGGRATQWLRHYIDHIRDDLLADVNERLLFVSKSGGRYVRNTLGDMVRRCVRAAGITKKGACHLFRHAMATHLLDNGADVRYIQEMLGHASLETTAQYTHVSIERLKAVHSACHPLERATAAMPLPDDETPATGV